jgi:hypothetical protein
MTKAIALALAFAAVLNLAVIAHALSGIHREAIFANCILLAEAGVRCSAIDPSPTPTPKGVVA